MKTFIESVTLNYNGCYDTKIIVHKEPGWFLKLFGMKPKVETYEGSGTVWYKRDKKGWLQRCYSSTEGWLAGIERTYKSEARNR